MIVSAHGWGETGILKIIFEISSQNFIFNDNVKPRLSEAKAFFSNGESRYPANSLAQRNLVRMAECPSKVI